MTNALLTGQLSLKPGDFEFPFLAGALGLKTVTFDTPSFLSNYLCDALACLDGHGIVFLRSDPVQNPFPNHITRNVHSASHRRLRSSYTEYWDDPIFGPRSETVTRYQSKTLRGTVAELLASFGWNVTLTAQSRDGGYDIFGISKMPLAFALHGSLNARSGLKLVRSALRWFVALRSEAGSPC